MVLSEVEAEAQLAALRRQREALDRAISDLTLYLELGRRLTTGTATIAGRNTEPASPVVAMGPIARPAAGPPESAVAGAPNPLRASASSGHASMTDRAPAAPSDREERPATSAPDHPRSGADPVVPEPAGPEGVLSEGVLARRYGRALIEAALSALDEAGRPLHAGEILAVLTSRGFSLPGHDPVAALNTRLWKRSGPGGPLKRMGDAVYALAETEEG